MCIRDSFCSVRTQVTDTVRTVYKIEVTRNDDDIITIRVTGNGFLYNMVRIIAGTLMAVGTGHIQAEDMPSILEALKKAFLIVVTVHFREQAMFGAEPRDLLCQKSFLRPAACLLYTSPALVMQAFAHGKHVLCDKPSANALAPALEMNRAAEKWFLAGTMEQSVLLAFSDRVREVLLATILITLVPENFLFLITLNLTTNTFLNQSFFT